jgi:hypothetical protein
MDLTAISHGFGPAFYLPIHKTDKIRIGPRLQFPLIYSRVTEIDYLRILDETRTTELRLYSWSIAMFPSVEATYQLSRWALALNIGYMFDSKGRLLDHNDMTVYLTQNENYYTTNWSGPHFDFRLGYTLFK